MGETVKFSMIHLIDATFSILQKFFFFKTICDLKLLSLFKILSYLHPVIIATCIFTQCNYLDDENASPCKSPKKDVQSPYKSPLLDRSNTFDASLNEDSIVKRKLNLDQKGTLKSEYKIRT